MKMVRTIVMAVMALLMLAPVAASLAAPAPPPAGAACRFILGFKALHDLIPTIVGDCRTDEYHNPQNGDGLQETVGGLLVWRKADNWTAFTDGTTTWINGPRGLQSRPNSERFIWEADAQPQPLTVQVFFSRHPQSDEDFTAVFPVNRTVVPEGQRVGTATLEALIAGPTAAEQAQGYFSELGGMLHGPSMCSGEDFILTIEDGLATVRFCREIASAGIGQDARVTVAIESTLRQFPTIQQVRLLTRDGHCLGDMSGLDLCLEP